MLEPLTQGVGPRGPAAPCFGPPVEEPKPLGHTHASGVAQRNVTLQYPDNQGRSDGEKLSPFCRATFLPTRVLDRTRDRRASPDGANRVHQQSMSSPTAKLRGKGTPEGATFPGEQHGGRAPPSPMPSIK